MSVPAASEVFIYFATRHPDLRTPFQSRWRQHAALSMSFPSIWDNVRLYMHYDAVLDLPQCLGAPGYDGVGMAWLKVGDVPSGDDGDEAMRVMRQDEAELFESFVSDTAYLGSETVIKEGDEVFKVFSSINADVGSASPAEIAAFGHAVAASELGSSLSRLAICTPNPRTPQGGRQHDGLIEFSFFTLDAAQIFFSSSVLAALGRAHPRVKEVERFVTRVGMRNDPERYG
jgi:hypothetical protein